MSDLNTLDDAIEILAKHFAADAKERKLIAAVIGWCYSHGQVKAIRDRLTPAIRRAQIAAELN